MNQKKNVVILSVVLFIAGGIWFMTRSSVEDDIRKQLHALKDEINKPISSNGIASYGRANQLKPFFTEDVQIEAFQGKLKCDNREDLINVATLVYSMATQIDVSLNDMVVSVTTPETAHVHLTVLFNGASQDWSQIQELEIDVVRQQGDWRIKAVCMVESLRLDDS